MFDFQKLDAYKLARSINRNINLLLKSHKLDKDLYSQLRRASLSIVLNLAEGTGKFSNPDKRNFYSIARGSTYECVAILEVLLDLNIIDDSIEKSFKSELERLSKMLMGLIKSTH